MPRGVYDRSKSKAQRATEKAAAPAQAAAPKKKYNLKKAVASAKAEFAEKIQNVGQVAGSELKSYEPLFSNRKQDLTGALRLLTDMRVALAGQGTVSVVPHEVSFKLNNLLLKAIDEFEKQLFPAAVQEAKQIEDAVTPAPAPSIGNGAPVPAPVAAAPVPFNPPTFTPAPAQS